MNEDALVETMATVIHNKSPKCYEPFGEDVCQCVHKARLQLAALRAEGFEVVHPSDVLSVLLRGEDR